MRAWTKEGNLLVVPGTGGGGGSTTALPLSGSTNGRPIPVAATATPGTLIHTAVPGTTTSDEVYVFASNVTGSSVNLTVEWGGTGAPADHIVEVTPIPANSLPIPIALGQRLNGSVIVRAFAGSAFAINITGFYRRG